jgi:hypothetical protein
MEQLVLDIYGYTDIELMRIFNLQSSYTEKDVDKNQTILLKQLKDIKDLTEHKKKEIQSFILQAREKLLYKFHNNNNHGNFKLTTTQHKPTFITNTLESSQTLLATSNLIQDEPSTTTITTAQTSHPLIQRKQTYVLDRKLLTIHAEDRDYRKYPFSNRFEIDLPTPIENVQSMRLIQCNFPINYYTFSNNYQNTKLSFQIDPKDNTEFYYSALESAFDASYQFTCMIQEGFYHPHELAFELQNKMNECVTAYLRTINENSDPYVYFHAYFDKVGQRFWFGNTKDQFYLLFDKKEDYSTIITDKKQPIVWEQYVNWGLPAYLGFDKLFYNTLSSIQPLKFNYLGSGADGDDIWINPDSPFLPIYYISAPYSPNLLGERVIYMEVNKFNSYDEVKPYSQNTNAMYDNDYNGQVNSAFAKIPVTNKPLGDLTDSNHHFLHNMCHYDPPIDKIGKLEFKFRYHDGRLVDFKNNTFNFTIEFNILKNEIRKSYQLRIPETYKL